MPIPPVHPSAAKVDHPGWAMLVSLVWLGFLTAFFLSLRGSRRADGAASAERGPFRWTRPMVLCLLGATVSYAILLLL